MTQQTSFVRLQPRRFVPDSEIDFISGTTYQTSFVPREPDEVFQQTTLNNRDDLSFTWDNGTLEFETSNAPDSDIFVVYSLYYSTSVIRYEKQDPVSDTGDIVEWFPRLQRHPALGQSVKNQLAGVLSSSSINVSINNDDYALNEFISKYDNYQNARATFYIDLDGTFKRLGSGIIKTIKGGKQISVNIKSLNKLYEQNATFGNDLQYYKATPEDYPNLFANSINRSIQYIPGRVGIIPDISQVFDASASSDRKYLGNPSGQEWQDPVTYYDGSTYYYLLVGIVDDYYDHTSGLSVSESSRFTDTNGILMVWVNVASSFVRSTFKYDRPQWFVGPTTYEISIVDIDYTNNRLLVTHPNPGTPGDTFTQIFRNPLTAKVMYPTVPLGSPTGNEEIVAMASLDSGSSDVGHFNTTNGKKLVYVRTTNAYNIETQRYSFILKNSSPRTFRQYAEDLIAGSGLTLDATSFDNVQSSNNVNMFDVAHENEVDSIGTLFQRAGNSMGCIIWNDDTDDTIRARIVDDSISGFDYEITASDILNPDLAPSVEYSDSRSEISFTNPRVQAPDFYDDANESKSSVFSVGFNNETRSQSYEAYVDDVTTTLDIKIHNDQGPKIFYKFSLHAKEFFDMQIGEIVRINNVGGRLLNLDTEIDVIIVELTKSAETIKVTGYEYKKIP